MSRYDGGLISSGDVDAALKSAPKTLSGVVNNKGITHFYMEKQSAVALPEEGERMSVHTSTQNPDGARRAVALVLGVEGSKVSVMSCRLPLVSSSGLLARRYLRILSVTYYSRLCVF